MTPPRNCRKTLVGASIARPCPFALQENRPGKCAAAVSWRATNGRPYTRNKAGMQFFDGLRSGQDRSLQLSRQRCGGYNKVGGNKKSHHGRWWDNSSSIHLLEFLRDRVRSSSRCNSNGVCGRSHSILRQQTRMIARTVIEANQRTVDIKNTQTLPSAVTSAPNVAAFVVALSADTSANFLTLSTLTGLSVSSILPFA